MDLVGAVVKAIIVAGGSVLDENGAPLRYNTKDDLLSPIFFASGIN
jgi:3'(2'), 5'-bisphosphate nucleotidase